MNKVKLRFGFTFIELLVSISIMVLMFTLGLGSYRDFVRRQQIDSVAREIKADLRLAQQEAIVGKKPDNPNCNSSGLIGYRVKFAGGTGYTGYEVFAVCEDGEVSVKSKLFGADSDMDMSPFSEFTFNSLARGVSSTVSMELRQISTGEVINISINQNGEIK